MKRVVLLLLLLPLLGGALVLVAWPLLVPGIAPDPAPEAGREPPLPVAGPQIPTPAEPETAAPEEESPADRVVLLVTGPDGVPVPRAEARVWEFQGRAHSREYVEVRKGRGDYALERNDLTELRIEVYGAEGCGPIVMDPIEPVAQVVEVRLPEPSAISVVVVDDEGKPVPGVRIEARTAYSEFRTGLEHVGRPHSAAVSGDDGSCRLEGLGGRDYHLRVKPPTGYVARDPRETVRGGTEGLRLVCQRLLTLAFRVLGPDGLPVVGAKVLLCTRRSGYCGKTDTEGWVRFQKFDPGRVRGIEVEPPDDREDVLARKLPNGLPDDPTIRLDRALPLAGVVRDEDGRVVPEGQVTWRRAWTAEPWTFARADVDGRFRIPRVPLGKIEIRAAAPDYEEAPDHHHVQTVDAGREDLAFVVKNTPSIVLRFEDWGERESGYGSLHIEGTHEFMARWMEVGKGGTVRYAGLRENDVASVFVKTNSGRVWVGHGLRPGENVQVVRGLAPSKITGRLVGVPKGIRLAVSATVLWKLEIEGRLEEDGRFEIAGVPPGTWRLTARTTHRGPYYLGEAEAPAGADVVIRMVRR